MRCPPRQFLFALLFGFALVSMPAAPHAAARVPRGTGEAPARPGVVFTVIDTVDIMTVASHWGLPC